MRVELRQPRHYNRERELPELDEFRSSGRFSWLIPLAGLIMIAVTGVVAHWIVYCLQNPDSHTGWMCFISVVGVVGIWRLIIYPTYYSGVKLGLIGWYKRFWQNDVVGNVAFWWLVDDVEYLEVVSRNNWRLSWRKLGYRGHAVVMPLGGWFVRAQALNNFQHDIAFSLKSWTDDVVVCTVNNRRLDPRLRRAPRDRFTISIYSLLTAFNEVSGDGWLNIPLDGAIQSYQRWRKECLVKIEKLKNDHDRYRRQVADDLHDEIKRVMSTHRFQYQKDGVNVLMCLIGDFRRLAPADDFRQDRHRATYKQLQARLEELS
ncbi:MAG: hypothetical protein V1695_01725 [Candidatus Uhrbacteria bacterium]